MNSRIPYSDDLRSNHSKMRDELNRISMELPEKTTGLGSGNYDSLGDPLDKTYGSTGRVYNPGGGGFKKGGAINLKNCKVNTCESNPKCKSF